MIFIRKIFLISSSTLISGAVGYFIFANHWLKYVFAHGGALGIIGLFSCLSGIIAERKGLDYRKAVSVTFFPPVILGIIGTYLVDPPRENGLPESCGGIVSLSAALIIIIVYIFANKKK